MKKLFLYFAICLTAGLASCSGDYPDDWGFSVRFEETNFAIVRADEASYDLQLSSVVTIDDEGMGITGCGFKVSYYDNGNNKEEFIECPFDKSGKQVTIETTMPDCLYNPNYQVSPYVSSGDFRYYGSTNSFSRSLSNMKPSSNWWTAPVGSTSIEMGSSAHVIVPVLECSEMISEVTFTFAGKTKTAKKQGQRFTAEFDLEELSAGNYGGYNGITFKVTNQFGSASGYIAYAVNVKDVATISYYSDYSKSGDGVKSDCVTFGGYDFAKGNLVCKNGKWGIDSDPLGHELTEQSSDFVQYFLFGHTDAQYNDFSNFEAYTIYAIGGDKRYDVVAANLGNNWRLPAGGEFYALMAASYQFCEQGVVFRPTYGQKRRYQSSAQVKLTQVPADGLFMPAGGTYSNYNNKTSPAIVYPNYGLYMTGYKDSGTTSAYCFYFGLGTKEMSVGSKLNSTSNGRYGYLQAYNDKYFVRPVRYSSPVK